jgi:CRP-like cAMP-binding protein
VKREFGIKNCREMRQMANNPSEVPPTVSLSYKKGDLIIKEGDYGVSIYKILEGTVSVYREAEGEKILLATLGMGDIFGERTFLNRAADTRSASVRALEDTTVEVWHTARLSREYDEMPLVIKYITDQVMSRSIRMNNLIVQLATKEQKEKTIRDKEDPLASKRKFYRKKVDLFCHYRPTGASSKFNLDGIIKDISLDGLAMKVTRRNTADVSHVAGDIFVVSTVLPNKKNVELEAEVVSVQKGDMFNDLEVNMMITEIAAGAKKSLGFFLMP